MMDVLGNLHEYLSAPKTVATQQCMERSISDVFRLMFNLDVALASEASPENKEALCAHILLRHESATACVSLSVLRQTALLVAERAGIDVSKGASPSVLQDVVCEIVNIIASAVRTFFSEKVGIRFEMSKILLEKPEIASSSRARVINLDFKVNSDAVVRVSFACVSGALN
jgi:hypothetical protein